MSDRNPKEKICSPEKEDIQLAETMVRRTARRSWSSSRPGQIVNVPKLQLSCSFQAFRSIFKFPY